MRLLLDTHVIVGWLVDPGKLRKFAFNQSTDPENDVFFSPVNLRAYPDHSRGPRDECHRPEPEAE
jgi:PIN domain nuclease of toxin-antitoxin system